MQTSLTNILFPHQVAAIEKLLPIRVGALFMDMGTGKTRTAIEMAARRGEKIDRVVWFCPVSLKKTIEYEIKKHTTTRTEDIYIFDDKTTDRNIPDAAWHIVGLESIGGSDRACLSANAIITEKTFVVVDEASYIKGHRAKRTQRITAMAKKAYYRLILTGTPISQGIQDLFAQMYFLSPKILCYRSWCAFEHHHIEYSEKYRGMIVQTHNEAWLAAKIAPYVYQVTKNECLTLPPKRTKPFFCALTPEQNMYYNRAKDIFFEKMADPENEYTSIPVFELFSDLQAICCGFFRNDAGEIEPIESDREDMLLSIVERLPDDKIIVWSKYRYSIDRILKKLSKIYGPQAVRRYHGGFNEKRRHRELTQWRTSKSVRFLIATQDAGGYGLDLTEASTAIFFSNGFKYSTRIQAEDRMHRIGQRRPVTYIDIWATCGIEDRISAAIENKKNAVKTFKNEIENRKNVREIIEKL